MEIVLHDTVGGQPDFRRAGRPLAAAGILLVLCLAVRQGAGGEAPDGDGVRPPPSGGLLRELVSVEPAPGESVSGARPTGGLLRDLIPGDSRPSLQFGGPGLPAAMRDRGIDSADVKWRRQARTTGVRMRMLNGPEIAYSTDGYSTGTESGTRTYLAGVMPVNNRWELAALNKFGAYRMNDGGARAGIDALTLRLGANPSVSFRPWMSVTPYLGLWDADGVGLGLAAGAQKSIGPLSVSGQAYAFEPWDEGYETVRQDGRRHGFAASVTVPVDRRLSILATAGHEWLETGPHAPGGRQYAGRRVTWTVRANWLALKRDGAYMGYGFRDPEVWSEDLVPVELGFFGQIGGERYFRPDGFAVLNPTERSLSQRLGVFYSQAISPHLGFTAEGYVGQDNYRGIDFGGLYGVAARLQLLVNERLKLWIGWGYDSSNTSMASGSGADSLFSFGGNMNF